MAGWWLLLINMSSLQTNCNSRSFSTPLIQVLLSLDSSCAMSLWQKSSAFQCFVLSINEVSLCRASCVQQSCVLEGVRTESSPELGRSWDLKDTGLAVYRHFSPVIYADTGRFCLSLRFLCFGIQVNIWKPSEMSSVVKYSSNSMWRAHFLQQHHIVSILSRRQ